MKRFFDPCRRQRRSLALLAAGVLREAERNPIEEHAMACPGCARHLAELRATSASLRNCANGVPQVQPGEAVKERWARAIQSAARPQAVPPRAVAAGFAGWWREVVWSSRGIWAGLAAAWVLIVAGQLSLRDHTQTFATRTPHPTKEVMMAFREQQAILNELLADHSAPREADRPKVPPKPRTETTNVRIA
jgi:hypothetical protein